MGRVGVAELKASLSKYLARVQAGETVIVTDHGRPVARLVPVESAELESDDSLRDLERLGVVRRSGAPLPEDFWTLPRPEDSSGRSLAILLAEREAGP